jgi:transposase
MRPEIRRRNCAAFLVLPRPATECVKPRPQYGLLTSVPGIGQTLATVIFLETGPIERFAEVGNFASYALRRQRAHQQSQEER